VLLLNCNSLPHRSSRQILRSRRSGNRSQLGDADEALETANVYVLVELLNQKRFFLPGKEVKARALPARRYTR
jgi:hypothetical protein